MLLKIHLTVDSSPTASTKRIQQLRESKTGLETAHNWPPCPFLCSLRVKTAALSVVILLRVLILGQRHQSHLHFPVFGYPVSPTCANPTPASLSTCTEHICLRHLTRTRCMVPHQLLCDLDFHAERSQVGREGVTKTVPDDMF